MNETWGIGRWVACIAGAVATIVVTVIADAVVGFAYSGTCGESGTDAQIATGRLWMLAISLVAAAVWALTARASARRGTVAIIGAVAALPSLLFLLNGLRDAAWVGTFCVF